MSADVNVIAGSPESQSNVSQKSLEIPSNNNESISESHTPPLPIEKQASPPTTKKRKSRFEDAPANDDSDNQIGNQVKSSERSKQEEKQTSKKPNEWDMFAEADNIGDFNVCSPYFLARMRLGRIMRDIGSIQLLLGTDRKLLSRLFRVLP